MANSMIKPSSTSPASAPKSEATALLPQTSSMLSSWQHSNYTSQPCSSIRVTVGNHSEDLENSFTKGNDDYSNNRVSAYHLINQYKCYSPKSPAPDSIGAPFLPRSQAREKPTQARTRTIPGKLEQLATIVAK